MRFMKRLFYSLLLVFVSTGVYAYDFQYGDLYYNITNNIEPYTVEVTSKTPLYPYNEGVSWTTINIPKTVTYNNTTYEVTSIGEHAFFGSSTLTSITLPNSLTSIGDGAFFGSSTLTSITLPNSLTSIGGSAFSECSSLKSITIPSGVTSIGRAAFSLCTSLNTIMWNAKNCKNFSSTLDAPFYSSPITSIVFGDSVEHIPAYLCYDMLITSIFLPKSIKSIGFGSFYRCSKLTSITIPNGVISIDYWAFKECTSLASIDIPESVIDISSDAFEKTAIHNNESNWENGILYISNCLIEAKKDIKECTIKKDTRLIATSAFSSCKSLTSISIPENVTNINREAFYECSSLSSITWNAKHCLDFEEYARPFVHTNITSICFGDSVKHIPAYLCYRMDSLTSITIPNSVVGVGKNAFSDCPSLEVIRLTAQSVEKFLKGKGNRLLAVNSYYWPRKLVIDDVETTDIVLPDGVDCIDTMSFFLCSSLTCINIPKSIKSIEYEAFSGCSSLTTINIPEGVKSIGPYVFSSCSSLSSITIPSSMVELGNAAFYHCTSLDTISCYAIIPPTVKNSTFDDYWETRYEAKLYVPCEALADYQEHEIWGQFKNIQCISSENTSIDNTISHGKKTNKLLHNGQLIILSEDKSYTITGQEL